MQETWVRFLGWGNPLEKGMATHSNILAWRIPWTEEPSELVHGVSELDMIEQVTHTHSPSLILEQPTQQILNSLTSFRLRL